ncbi:hypothetical protein Bca52824_027075 [Brassica carinata]|uniref:Hexosyltransferase n=1 Tax=Brassica carinata TaxID=52824 RepID=A0A8X7SJ90_BRACI|nr:hypothetical protein Bca52824_027075 [Brassica carinata]
MIYILLFSKTISLNSGKDSSNSELTYPITLVFDINSTALNSKPEKVVFHLVTNEINYAAMKSWFAMNMDNLRGVTVEVQKFEDFKWLNASYVPVLKQLHD